MLFKMTYFAFTGSVVKHGFENLLKGGFCGWGTKRLNVAGNLENISTGVNAEEDIQIPAYLMVLKRTPNIMS